MTKTINLATSEEMTFDDKTLPVYAVVYAYCMENNLISELFKHCHDNTLNNLYAKLDISYGKYSVACGDWASKLN